MRRLLLAVPLLLAVALVAALHQQPHRTFAISYPAGWNLISAPDGSLVRGAQGPLYTFQPGDLDYEQFPATSPLHGGYGYWAFFPSGGTVDLAAGTPRYTVTLIPGEYTMVGNPSSQMSASVEGADQVLLYDPISGMYVPSNEIPAGQGALVLGAGTVVITGVGTMQPITVAGSGTPSPVPTFNANFTARCNDGSYDYAPRSAATCQAHGGVAAFGPGAAITATPTPIRATSQPQARCNDGAFDYSNTPTPCAFDGGVAYYISLPAQEVPTTPQPAPGPAY